VGILQVTLHAHAAREEGSVSKLIGLVDSKTGEQSKKKPRVLLKGQSAVVEVSASRPMCLELYADCRALGRLVLREGGQTIAVGIIVKILN
jgi:elongation factor 1 alpha-like protein